MHGGPSSRREQTIVAWAKGRSKCGPGVDQSSPIRGEF